jgi:hypothetical protein
MLLATIRNKGKPERRANKFHRIEFKIAEVRGFVCVRKMRG